MPARIFSLRKPHLAAMALAMAAIVTSMYYMGAASAKNAAPNGAAPTAPEVEVVLATSTPIRTWDQFAGRLEAVEHVEIQPRVSGTITEILFKEGAVVEKGAPLFVIDTRPYEADLASAKAALAAAQSRLTLAVRERDRARKLVKSNHISRSTLDARENDYKVSRAEVNAAKANKINAELDLEYAHINAPVAGRVSRAEITVGNVIESGAQAPVLTTIVSNDKLYAEFDVDEQTYLHAIRNTRDKAMPVELTLPSDQGVVYRGHVHSFDNQINPTTGTIRARAIFSNDDGALVPGMYANVRIGSAGKAKHIAIPERAVGTDQNRKYVYVVDKTNAVIYREVVLGRIMDGKRIIQSGISDGEYVMVNSLQRVRPGMHVVPIDINKQPQQAASKAPSK